ncbi:hypothetical protein EV1_015376 [Malus domestica]
MDQSNLHSLRGRQGDQAREIHFHDHRIFFVAVDFSSWRKSLSFSVIRIFASAFPVDEVGVNAWWVSNSKSWADRRAPTTAPPTLKLSLLFETLKLVRLGAWMFGSLPEEPSFSRKSMAMWVRLLTVNGIGLKVGLIYKLRSIKGPITFANPQIKDENGVGSSTRRPRTPHTIELLLLLHRR